jgi:ABC-type nitrate/sulfonate/bicarbonate transport system substrate-binding protein
MMRKSVLSVGAVLAAVSLSACASGAPASAGPENTTEPEAVRIVIPAESALFWDIYVADAQGLFESNSITPEITLTPGPAATLAAMSGGGADVGTPFAEQGLAAIEKGAPMSIFVGESNTILVSVVGQKGIETAEQLRNQKIAAANVDDTATYLMQTWLADEGVSENEFDKIIIGASNERYQAIVTGAVAAATLTSPIDRQAIREGYPVIEAIAEPGILTAHFGTDDFLNNRPEAAARYAKAIQESVAWLLDPANEEAAIKILVDRTKVNEEDAQATYDLYMDNDVFIEGSPIDESLLDKSFGFLIDTGRMTGSPDPADYIDPEPLVAAADLE